MSDITIKQAKKSNSFNITMKNLTLGKVLALTSALADYARHSPVGEDVLDMLVGAIESASLSEQAAHDLRERYAPTPKQPVAAELAQQPEPTQ